MERFGAFGNNFEFIFRGIMLRSYSVIGHGWLVQVKDVYGGLGPKERLKKKIHIE